MDETAPDTAFYRELLDGLSEGVYFVDRDRRITYWNRGAERITGRERLYIQASYQQSLNHVDEAVRSYRLLFNAYPDDSGAHYSLGVLLMHNYRCEEAIAELARVPAHALLVPAAHQPYAVGISRCNRLVNCFPQQRKLFEFRLCFELRFHLHECISEI